MILGGALQRRAVNDEAPFFIVKGGVALELRMGTAGRATEDLDVILLGASPPVEALQEALAVPYQGFSFRVKPKTHRMGPDAVRVHVALDYLGKPWGTVQVDVSHGDEARQVEFVEAIALADLGLEGPATLTCLSLSYQVAHKLHAVSRPASEGLRNDRFRDIADLLLMRDWVEVPSDLVDPCREVFKDRGTHQWPPLIPALEEWIEPFKRMAHGIGLHTTDLHQAVVEIRNFVFQIDDTAWPWNPIRQPEGLTATTWHYAITPERRVVRLPQKVGDDLIRGEVRDPTVVKPEWQLDSGGVALIGVVILLKDRKPLFVERAKTHPVALTEQVRDKTIAYDEAVWISLAADILKRSRAPRRAEAGLGSFLAVQQGQLPAQVAMVSGDSTAWMHQLWPRLGRYEAERVVWDLQASVAAAFQPPRRPRQRA